MKKVVKFIVFVAIVALVLKLAGVFDAPGAEVTETPAVVTEEVNTIEVTEEVVLVAPVEAKTTPPAVVVVEPIQTTAVVVAPSTATDVKVYMFDGSFDFSQKDIPAGAVTFTVTNHGRVSHNFGIEGVQEFGKVKPNETKTFTAVVASGEYHVHSSNSRDTQMGMRETLNIR